MPRPHLRRCLPTLACTAVAVLATATAAAAHPGFRPDEVPTGGPVAVELVVPHGCGDEAGGAGTSPTVLVLAQESDEFVLVPSVAPGWEVQAEDGAAGWRAVDGGTADELVLPALVEVDAAVGTQLAVAVYQECADGQSYRWAAAEGEDGDPAVRLTVVDGTPPPLPTPTPTPVPTPTPAPTPSPTPAPSPSTTPTPTSTPSPTTTPTPAPSPSVLAAEEDGAGGLGAGAIAAIVAAAVAIGLLAWWLTQRGGPGDAPAGGGPTGAGGPGDPEQGA